MSLRDSKARERPMWEVTAVNDDRPLYPTLFLTRTEAIVVECRKRGMSDTAIRRLLQLSAAEAVALGIIPSQAGGIQGRENGCDAGSMAASWPQMGELRDRRRVFPRRRPARTGAARRPRGGRRRLEDRERQLRLTQPALRQTSKTRGESE